MSATNPAQTFAYDDAGNMTQGFTREGYTFSALYDAENRLKSLEYLDGVGMVHKLEYFYAGDGFLAQIKKYENSSLVNDKRIVRSGFLALQERDAGNVIQKEYTWGLNMGGGIGGLLNQKQGAIYHDYLYDGKGNVTALIDSAQNVAATYRYDAFGNLMAKTGSVDQQFMFSTKRYDASTGLSYFGYRFYNASISKWLTRDPLGERGGINLYAYVQNDPVNYVDPDGLVPVKELGVMILIGLGIYVFYEFFDSSYDACINGQIIHWLNMEKQEAMNEGDYDSAAWFDLAARDMKQKGTKMLVEIIANAPPGTSLTGPVPTSAAELTLDQAKTLIQNHYLNEMKKRNNTNN